MTGEKMWQEYCLLTNMDINTRHDLWKFLMVAFLLMNLQI
mgnify:CR=1 FL=1